MLSFHAPIAIAVLAAPAQAASLNMDVLADQLADMDSHDTRVGYLRALLGGKLTDADEIARVSTALSVLQRLQADGRTESFVVRHFMVAALSSEPALRQAALDAAESGAEPPTAVVTVPVVSEPTEPSGAPGVAAQLREYDRRHLLRDAYRQTRISGSIYFGMGSVSSYTWDTWMIYDGRGLPVRPIEFATLTKDHETLAAVGRRETAAWAYGGGFAIVAFGVFAAAAQLTAPITWLDRSSHSDETSLRRLPA